MAKQKKQANWLYFTKVRDVNDPVRAHWNDAGIDFFVPNDFEQYRLKPGKEIKIPSGIKMNLPTNHVLIGFNKSSIPPKKGLIIGSQVIDESYMGEIQIHLMNVTNKATYIYPGEKIVQYILLPVAYDMPEMVESEETLFKNKDSERKEGGFGSTNKDTEESQE